MITLYTPHVNQQKIHDSINNEPYKYYILNIGRQFGKSLLAENQCLYWLFNDRGCEAAWVSPTYKQAKKVYKEMVKAFEGTGLLKTNATELTIEIGLSKLQFFSAERYDNIRGFTFDYLVCDEFAFMDAESWTEVLRATVLVRGKKVLLISTPKGKNHFFHIHTLDGTNPQYKSFKMTSYDNPIINPTEIDDARDTLPDHVFRQEYLAEFIDGGSGLFNGVLYSNDTKKDKRCYAGVDLGRADDYTVLSIINSKGEQIYIERWRHDSWSNIVDKVASKINEYGAITYVEVNSIGDAIYEQIQDKVTRSQNIKPFVTSTKSKPEIIESLAVACQGNEIILRDETWLKKEMEVFTYEYKPKTKSVIYSAPSGFHDDGVIATAISYYAYKNAKSLGKYTLV